MMMMMMMMKELSIPDFEVDSVEAMNPEWINRNRSELDVMPDLRKQPVDVQVEPYDVEPWQYTHSGTDATRDMYIDDIDGLLQEADAPFVVADDVDGPLASAIEESDQPELAPNLASDPDGELQLDPPPQPQPMEIPQNRQKYFMANSLTISGSEHMLNNLTRDIHETIPKWNDFFNQLKNFETLLGTPDNRRHLVQSLFKDTALEKKPVTLYWTLVVLYISLDFARCSSS